VPVLIGYASALCVRPGDTVDVMVSTTAPSYVAQPVRLIHGDTDPAGPGFREEPVAWDGAATLEGRVQTTHPGSDASSAPTAAPAALRSFTLLAWVQPTLATSRRSGILTWWDDRMQVGFGLFREAEGDLSLHVGSGKGATEVFRTETQLPVGAWSCVIATRDGDSGAVHLEQTPRRRGPIHFPASGEGVGEVRVGELSQPVRIAAFGGVEGQVEGFFTGKIDRPAILSRPLTEAERIRIAAGEDIAAVGALDDVFAAWDFGADQQRASVSDLGHSELDLSLVNAPARAVTGFNWSGDEVDHRRCPQEYGAIHFHEDDLDDARWEVDFTLTVPDDAPSGVYAARLRAGHVEDHVPIVVRPRDGATADVLLVLPTFTWLAYANERLVTGAGTQYEGMAGQAGLTLDFADELLAEHPEWGISLYDVHSDGSACMYASRLRPIPNLRPRYRFWCTGGPERLSEDLCIVDWLEHIGVRADVVTDEDLHREGAALLERYPVVLTGSHPEYVSSPMMAAVETYLEGGGHLMYLGGNGFYWVIAVDEERPHILELRRGVNGSRTWESAPGECHHSTTGELGGLWRYRGRSPNRLVGVGYAAASGEPVPSAGYFRCADSYDKRVGFIFEGVSEDEVIGDFGLIRDGAAGYEIDRLDFSRGTPEHALLLASSRGRHGPGVLLAVEDMLSTLAHATGDTNPDVRADVTYLEYPNGGAVFSVGSCNWCGSLSHDGYRNNVARITGNVLQAFRSGSQAP